MTRKQRRALKELRKMKEVMILPADKGNATVLMNKEEYSTKMRNMLATLTYKELKNRRPRLGRCSRDWSG